MAEILSSLSVAPFTKTEKRKVENDENDVLLPSPALSDIDNEINFGNCQSLESMLLACKNHRPVMSRPEDYNNDNGSRQAAPLVDWSQNGTRNLDRNPGARSQDSTFTNKNNSNVMKTNNNYNNNIVNSAKVLQSLQLDDYRPNQANSNRPMTNQPPSSSSLNSYEVSKQFRMSCLHFLPSCIFIRILTLMFSRLWPFPGPHRIY